MRIKPIHILLTFVVSSMMLINYYALYRTSLKLDSIYTLLKETGEEVDRSKMRIDGMELFTRMYNEERLESLSEGKIRHGPENGNKASGLNEIIIDMAPDYSEMLDKNADDGKIYLEVLPEEIRKKYKEKYAFDDASFDIASERYWKDVENSAQNQIDIFLLSNYGSFLEELSELGVRTESIMEIRSEIRFQFMELEHKYAIMTRKHMDLEALTSDSLNVLKTALYRVLPDEYDERIHVIEKHILESERRRFFETALSKKMTNEGALAASYLYNQKLADIEGIIVGGPFLGRVLFDKKRYEALKLASNDISRKLSLEDMDVYNLLLEEVKNRNSQFDILLPAIAASIMELRDAR